MVLAAIIHTGRFNGQIKFIGGAYTEGWELQKNLKNQR